MSVIIQHYFIKSREEFLRPKINNFIWKQIQKFFFPKSSRFYFGKQRKLNPLNELRLSARSIYWFELLFYRIKACWNKEVLWEFASCILKNEIIANDDKLTFPAAEIKKYREPTSTNKMVTTIQQSQILLCKKIFTSVWKNIWNHVICPQSFKINHFER